MLRSQCPKCRSVTHTWLEFATGSAMPLQDVDEIGQEDYSGGGVEPRPGI